jgi:hypothetical protein
MKASSPALLRIAAVTALLASSGSAHAVLQDHGPGDSVLVFPLWYRDLNGLALQLCRSTTPSPNPNAGLKPMCIALPSPDAAGFPGNVGPEIFYSRILASVGKGTGGFSMKYLTGLEASYLPAGVPVHGTEAVFARVRVFMTPAVAGTYTVTHPYGVEVFPDLPAGKVMRFTDNVLVTMNFDAALNGRIGPFPRWDVVNPGESLSVTNAAGQVEEFVGDPNYDHTFTGSPFGTNFIRVDGPPGSNLDGAGNDFIQTPLATVFGQKYLLPIASPMTVTRASYSRDPVKNINSIDLFATALPSQRIIVTGSEMPTVQMTGDAAGRYMAHIDYPARVALPDFVTVTNVSDNPPTSVDAALHDVVEITNASFDTLTNTLTVTATSSDLSVPPPALVVVGPDGGPMIGGAYSTVITSGIPPHCVTVQSTAGDAHTDEVAILPGLPTDVPFAPVALADTIATNEDVAVTADVSANDATTPPAGVGQVLIVTPPANGTAVAAAAGGLVTYTPATLFFGADAFQYVLVDTLGNISNVATANVTVNFLPVGPTANDDNFAVIQNSPPAVSSRTYNGLGNDVAAPGTFIDPASVVIVTPPLHGTAAANPDGTVTYTPLANYVGVDSYQYTVRNTAGNASNAATVSIVVEGSAEVLSFIKANYAVGKAKWTIVGSSSWFAGPLTPTATCYIGKGLTGANLGTTPIVLGKFQLVPATAPPPDATSVVTCQSSNGAIASALLTILP